MLKRVDHHTYEKYARFHRNRSQGLYKKQKSDEWNYFMPVIQDCCTGVWTREIIEFYEEGEGRVEEFETWERWMGER